MSFQFVESIYFGFNSSLTQLSDMSENEDVLLEFFVTLPQLKQVASDKEDLVNSIVHIASEYNSAPMHCHSL